MATTAIDREDRAQREAGRTMILQYLHEAHATEQALVTNLCAHIAMTPSGAYRRTLERHLAETRQHARAVEHRLGELGGGTRGLVGLAYGAVQTLVGQALVLTKGPLDMIRGGGGEEKLVKNAKDEAATEMLEIATYDALEELARAIGDEQTARLAARHREQEERALRELRGHIVKLTHAAVLARAGGQPSYDWEATGAAQAVKVATGAPGEPPIADYDLAQRQPGRHAPDRPLPVRARAPARLRARQPQPLHGHLPSGRPAGERAVHGLRRPHRPRRRRAAARLRREDGHRRARVRRPPPPPRRGARGGPTPAVKPEGIATMPVLEVPQPQTPDQPIVPDAPVTPAVPDPGPEQPDTPDGPGVPQPDAPEVPPPS